MRVPTVYVALPLLTGACAGVLLVDAISPAVTVAAAGGTALALIAAVGFLVEHERDGVIAAVVLGALLAGCASGASTTRQLYEPELLAWFLEGGEGDSDPVILTGLLRADADAGAGAVMLTLDVREVEVRSTPRRLRGGVRLFVAGDPPPERVAEWRAGRTIRLSAILRLPVTFSDPGVPEDRRSLARRGIVLTGSAKSASLIEVVASAGWLQERAADVRSWVRAVLAREVGRMDQRSAAVATAIVIGDRTGLSEEDERRLQDAGTYHVIAISGGNIAIFTVVLLAGARILRLPIRGAAALAIVVLLFYGEIAGGAPSVGRAITAALIFLGALTLDHRGAALNVVGVAAIIAVAGVPVTILDAGFLLSFGATAGIILGVPKLEALSVPAGWREYGPWWRAILTATAGVLAATICAEIALVPVAASFFSRVTFAGIVLNFAAIPLMAVVQCGAMTVLAASVLCEPAAPIAAVAVHWAAFGLVESSRLVDVVPWVARDVPRPAWWLCVAYYACALTAVLTPRYRRPVLAGLALATAALVLGVAPASGGARPAPAGAMRIAMLDVGQGDATAVIVPDGRALLVDAGGLVGTSFDVASRVVLPSLRALGVRRLHALVLTHGDPDHVGGAAVLLRRLPPQAVWEGVPVPPDPVRRALIAAAESQGIVWRTVRPGDIDRMGGVDIRVLHPPEPEWERQRVRNDDSVVLAVRYGDVSILLPGDIGHEAEQSLIPLLNRAPIVVLKAAHHGSATSSSDAFIDAIRPAAVIFSAGRNNRFNHPAPVVVERFRSRGVEMFNTADDGAVFVETDGRSVSVWGWKSGRLFATSALNGPTALEHEDTKDTTNSKRSQRPGGK